MSACCTPPGHLLHDRPPGVDEGYCPAAEGGGRTPQHVPRPGTAPPHSYGPTILRPVLYYPTLYTRYCSAAPRCLVPTTRCLSDTSPLPACRGRFFAVSDPCVLFVGVSICIACNARLLHYTVPACFDNSAACLSVRTTLNSVVCR